jgi:hypothetical protein
VGASDNLGPARLEFVKKNNGGPNSKVIAYGEFSGDFDEWSIEVNANQHPLALDVAKIINAG